MTLRHVILCYNLFSTLITTTPLLNLLFEIMIIMTQTCRMYNSSMRMQTRNLSRKVLFHTLQHKHNKKSDTACSLFRFRLEI